MKRSVACFGFSGVVALAFFLYATTAGAKEEQYQAEISAEYTHLEASDDFKMSLTGISGEVFFGPVNTKDHPYAEAAFLERVGSVFLAADLADVKGTSSTGDGMIYEVGVNLARPGFPLAVQIMYGSSEFDYDPPSSASYEVKSYGVRAGNYFTDHLLAGLEYMYSKAEWSSSVFPTMTTKFKDYGLFAQYVQALSQGRHLSFKGNLGQSTSEDDTETEKNTIIGLSADYFFNRALSTGIGIERSSGDAQTDEGMTYTANVRHFFTPRISLQVAYERFLNSNAGFASDWSYRFGAAVRF